MNTLKATPATVRALLLAALLALVPLATAHASTTQPTIIQDDPELIDGSQQLRDQRLDTFKSLGVGIVKVRVRWGSIAPGGKRPPSGFDGRNPDAYPPGAWAPYDAVVQDAQARGMQVFFDLGGSAPLWATGGKHRSAIYQPNAAEFAKFVTAVGRRYPTVHLFSVWNEPNLASWLAPQYKSGVPYSPVIYRALLYGARDGLDASGHSGDQLLLGELLPFARSGHEGSVKVRPISFLRELACVDKHYRPYRGKAAQLRSCQRFRALPGSGVAYHPYTLAGGPNISTPNPDDASIENLGRVTKALDRLSGRHRLLGSRLPIWITEFGFQSDPPDPYQTPLARIPGFLGQSEWIAFRNPRVASYSQYPYIDDAGRINGFQSGLRYHNGKAKPGVWQAFRTPLWVRLVSSSRVEIFGGVRWGTSGDVVTIQSRSGSRGKWTTLTTSPLNSRGYFDRVVTAGGARKRQFRFFLGNVSSRAASPAR